MHKRKTAKAMLTLLGFVLIHLCVSSLHVAQGVRVEEAVMKSASRMQPLDRPQAVPLLATTEGDIQWERTYGGAGADAAYVVIQTADGGFALAGRAASFGAGEDDFWLVKTDRNGIQQWTRTYGGAGSDWAYAVTQTTDGGFALAGGTVSFGAGGADGWLVKTDARGTLQWNQTYGGSKLDEAYAIIETSDGGFVLAGRTQSYGADTTDVWLVKTDTHGNMEWQQTYGGSDDERAFSVIQMTDGGFTLAGYTFSYGAGKCDAWLVKTDATGNMEWQQTYGGAGGEIVYAGIQTTDGGFALAGPNYATGGDAWLVKTDAHGNMEWQQTYGGSHSDYVYAVIETADGGFALAGCTEAYGAVGTYGWLVKMDVNGTMEWTKTYGGEFYDVIQTADGGFALAGAASEDGWLVKTIPPEATPPELSVPTVTMVSPNGGESWQDMQTITWTATDPQADPLTYMVYYSPNGGRTWTQLASGVTETSYQWDTSNVQVGENYLIKIEASDGRFTTEDRSDYKFTVEREVPAETRSEAFFVPSFRVVEALGALLVLLGLGDRRRRRNKLMEGF